MRNAEERVSLQSGQSVGSCIAENLWNGNHSRHGAGNGNGHGNGHANGNGICRTEERTELPPAFQHGQYQFRQKTFKLFGFGVHVYDGNGNTVLYSELKRLTFFKMREDFRVYSDERQKEELLVIKSPQFLDMGATFCVEDPATGRVVGAIAIKRKEGFKSLFKNEWIFLSNEGQEIAMLTETSIVRAALRMFSLRLIPQNYVVLAKDKKIAEIREISNQFALKRSLTITDAESPVDRRLLVAGGILLAWLNGTSPDWPN